MDEIRAAISKTLEDPQWFFTNILHFPLLDWQLEAINAVLDIRRSNDGLPTLINHEAKARITIRSCHGTGKTQFLACLLHVWNFVHYGKIACTAPKQDQLLKRLLPRYRLAFSEAEPFYRDIIKVLGREIIINDDRDWGASMETASEPDNLAGYHDTPQLFVIDEAGSRVIDPMVPVIQGALTTTGSALVEIGNPTRTEGSFYRHHTSEKLEHLYYRIHVKHTDAPELISQSWIDTMQSEYGEDSPIYRIRVLGEFASFDGYVLIPLDLIDMAMDELRPEDGTHPSVVVSADIADGGADNTVITAAKRYGTFTQVLKQTKHSWEASIAIPRAAEAVEQVFLGYGGRIGTNDSIVVDANGVGAGVAGILIEKGYNVIRHVGGASSPNYKNVRTSNYMALYRAFVDGAIAIAPDAIEDKERFLSRLTSIKRASADRNDEIETKKSMQQQGLPSPDEADSLAMLFIDQPNEFTKSNIAPEAFRQSEFASYESDAALT